MSDITQFKKDLFSIAKHLKADFEHRLKASGSPLTALQYAVLSLIVKKKSTANELAKYLGIKAPSLIPVIDSLEKQHLLKRERDSDDRRKAQLLITEKGKKMIKTVPLGATSEIIQNAFKELGSEKASHLIRLIKELTTIIEKSS